MRKIQKISDLQPTIGFTEFDIYNQYRHSFASSELGGLYRSFPFSALAKELGLQDQDSGRPSYFSPEGKIGLMVLKNYSGLSDKDLIAQLNANLHYQLFCGVRINPLNPLDNFKIVSEIRCEIARKMDIDQLQLILAAHWKPYLENPSVVFSDATRYESHLRFPTNEKLLFESIDWIHNQLVNHCKSLKIRRPRNKFDDIAKRYQSFSKTRKKTLKKKYKLRRSLIYLLGKLCSQLTDLEKAHKSRLDLSGSYRKRRQVILRVLEQQEQMQQTRKSCPDRIVSIDKHYVRPIVRGKETKQVEFGAKANLIQVDGINFIEHIDFKAFNEGTRGISCIQYAQSLMRKKVTHFAGDCIYATNKTRTYCSCRQSPIYTSFKPKGRPGKEEAERRLMRSMLSKERSTRLEGSFGTEKEHYNLRKIKARTKETEILWIFFGIHTANAVRMIPKMERALKEIKQSA
ncbi:DDE transposase [Bacteroidia bacterium]|nr:DDE transposase [Bacteroidia bacterium]